MDAAGLDDPSSTPLDLLLNAITGGKAQYGAGTDTGQAADASASGADGAFDEAEELNLQGLLGSTDFDFSALGAAHEADRPGSASTSHAGPSGPTLTSGSVGQVGSRDEQVIRGITQCILHGARSSLRRKSAGSGIPADPLERHSALLSTIQVWHPTAAQKSYGKERRLLAPPPFVRVSGPILSSLSSLTLSSIPSAEASDDTQASSSQTHRIAVSSAGPSLPASPLPLRPGIPPPQGKKARKAETRRLFKETAAKSGFGATLPAERSRQEAREREELADGLSFPGLWITQGDEGGKKGKAFRLRLDVRLSSGGATEQVPPVAAGAVGAVLQPQVSHHGDDPSSAIAPTDLMGLESDIIDHDIYALEHADLERSAGISSTAGPSTPIGAIGGHTEQQPAWASLLSSSLAIVSKPSQKTAKSRSVSSCLPETASFALWVRINAQTVRTKYLKLDDALSSGGAGGARLTSRTAKWTPFRFEMVYRADLVRSAEIVRSADSTGDEVDGVKILTYGSIVRLMDVQSGTKSEPVRLVRVEKNEVMLHFEQENRTIAASDHGQPVSELQRIGMVRVEHDGQDVLEDGRRVYLSAPGARIGGGELRDPGEGRTVWIGRNRKLPKPALAATPPAAEGTVQPPGSIDLDPPLPPETLEQAGLDLLLDAKIDSSSFDLPGVDSDSLDPLLNRLPLDGLDGPDIVPPGVEFAETGTVPGTEDDGPRPKKRLKTKRNALAAAVVAEQEGSAGTACSWTPAERRIVTREEKVGKMVISRRAEVEVVEDWMCWVIAGVDDFTHSFLDLSAAATPPATASIHPAPRLLREPMYDPESHSLQLTLSDFFVSSPTSRPVPLEVYLGPLGPLPAAAYRSMFTKDPAKDRPVPAHSFDGEMTSPRAAGEDRGEDEEMSTFPAHTPHVIVRVRLPALREIQRLMQVLRAQVEATSTSDSPARAAAPGTPGPPPTATATATVAGRTLTDPASIEPVAVQAPVPLQPADDIDWLDQVTDLHAHDLDTDGTEAEAIRQALQSVSQAAEAADVTVTPYHGLRLLDTIDSSLQIPLDAIPGTASHTIAGREQSPPRQLAGRDIHATTPVNMASVTAHPATTPGTASKTDHEDSASGSGMPLPLFLVKRPGEVAFALGWSVVMRRDAAQDSQSPWSLRLIKA